MFDEKGVTGEAAKTDDLGSAPVGADSPGSGPGAEELPDAEDGQEGCGKDRTTGADADGHGDQAGGGEEAPGASDGTDPSEGTGKGPDAADTSDGRAGGAPGDDGKKDKKDIQIEELTDRYKRTLAEFDNYRKRTDKEKSQMYEIGARDVLEKLLPIADSFERGLEAIPDQDKASPVAEGMDKIYRQLLKTLADIGVKPIEAAGQPFDPAYHNAVMHTEDETLGENVVAQELQRGYLYRESVLRHSMVKVAN
jgi:molecular chaperone GrpE